MGPNQPVTSDFQLRSASFETVGKGFCNTLSDGVNDEPARVNICGIDPEIPLPRFRSGNSKERPG